MAEDLDTVYADLAPDGRWVAVGMVTSVDGGATVDGVSGSLGGEGDLAAFRALRGAVDVILVGAATARREGYGPPTLRPSLVARRRSRGLADRPAMAIVSASLDLTGAERLFAEDGQPIVLTCATAPADRRDAIRARGGDVMVVGDDAVDLAAALDALADRGLTRVLVEGGPRIVADLLRDGLVDEVFVTVGALLAGTSARRLVDGELPTPVTLALQEGRVHGDEVLLRYAVRDRHAG